VPLRGGGLETSGLSSGLIAEKIIAHLDLLLSTANQKGIGIYDSLNTTFRDNIVYDWGNSLTFNDLAAGLTSVTIQV